MNILNEGYYFERHGDGFVYRSTIFSPGYSISAAQKDRLFAEFKRLERRLLIEGFALIAVVAGLFMSGLVSSPTPIPWFVLLSAGGLMLLMSAAIFRKRRLVEKILGRRSPDTPRLPLRQALTRPRPVLDKRLTLPIMRSIIGLVIFTIVVVDLVALVPVIAVFLPERITESATYGKAIAEALSQTLYSATYWGVVVALNVGLLICVRLLIRELGRVRSYFEMNERNQDTNTA